jgi:RNA polymerase sigma-70 factor (ECF subfamily)
MLVRRLLSGDERAFDELFHSYFPRLYAFAMARLRQDASSAEEVAQATLSKAMLRIDTFRGEAPLFSWLCTFCRHEISAHLRLAQKHDADRALAPAGNEAAGPLDLLADPRTGDPQASLERSELTRAVHDTLDELPGRYGEVLEWKYIEGLSLKEIGERLGSSAKAAESMLGRARLAFQEAFPAEQLPADRHSTARVEATDD